MSLNTPRNMTKCRLRPSILWVSIGAIRGSTTRIGCIAGVVRQLATQGTVGGGKNGAFVVYGEAGSMHRVGDSVGEA